MLVRLRIDVLGAQSQRKENLVLAGYQHAMVKG